jgi:hypothetical protein
MHPSIHTPDEEGFIPFIHNYCDRWCERCRFVDRCRVGYEELDAEKGGFKERTLQESMEEAAEDVRKTLELVEQVLRDQGIDTNEVRKEIAQQEQKDPQQERRKSIREHPLSVMTRDYVVASLDWREEQEDALKSVFHALGYKAELNIEPEDQLAEAERFDAALELLSHHAMAIGSKTDRALMGREDDFGLAEGEDEYQDDYNGSAKVARILMERSLAAWGTVLEVAPELGDSALPVIVELERIHRMLLEEFPHTDKFIRPGFDAPEGG